MEAQVNYVHRLLKNKGNYWCVLYARQRCSYSIWLAHIVAPFTVS